MNVAHIQKGRLHKVDLTPESALQHSSYGIDHSTKQERDNSRGIVTKELFKAPISR